MADLLTFLNTASIARDAIIGLFGLCVGSFLNVLALRTLAERNPFWPPSHCPSCQHRLELLDLIPVLSYLLAKAKCRYCQARISWQYPLVELITAVFFIAIVHRFGFELEGWGMLVFAATLIAVCITDFREKLIPHEITYPAMVSGLVYNVACSSLADQGIVQQLHFRHDLVECLVGVGISYMLFDFIAFYGIGLYKWMHRNDSVEPEELAEEEESDPQLDRVFAVANQSEKIEEEQELEVMGGGDAVLGAVISAWLGVQRFGVALFVGFILGALLGAVYLAIELRREKMLGLALVPSLIASAIILVLVESGLALLAYLTQSPFFGLPFWQLGLFAIGCGALLGVVKVGSQVSKPFPFGPALAGGAIFAMFYDPFISGAGGA